MNEYEGRSTTISLRESKAASKWRKKNVATHVVEEIVCAIWKHIEAYSQEKDCIKGCALI